MPDLWFLHFSRARHAGMKEDLLEFRTAAKDAIVAAVSHPKYKLRWVPPERKEDRCPRTNSSYQTGENDGELNVFYLRKAIHRCWLLPDQLTERSFLRPSGYQKEERQRKQTPSNEIDIQQVSLVYLLQLQQVQLSRSRLPQLHRMTKIMGIRQQMCSRLPQEMLVTHWLRHVQIAPKLRLLFFLMTDQKYCRLLTATLRIGVGSPRHG